MESSYFIIAAISAIFTVSLKAIVNSVCSYAKEKGKNKAHKEDDKELTRIVEDSRHVQDIKRNAILGALNFIDTYFSWLDWSNPTQTGTETTFDPAPQPARETMTIEKITTMARKCYNELSLSCSQEIVDEFLIITFSKDETLREEGSCLTKEYNKFRNLARKELDLTSINFSEEKVFLARIGTSALMAGNNDHQ